MSGFPFRAFSQLILLRPINHNIRASATTMQGSETLPEEQMEPVQEVPLPPWPAMSYSCAFAVALQSASLPIVYGRCESLPTEPLH